MGGSLCLDSLYKQYDLRRPVLSFRGSGFRWVPGRRCLRDQPPIKALGTECLQVSRGISLHSRALSQPVAGGRGGVLASTTHAFFPLLILCHTLPPQQITVDSREPSQGVGEPGGGLGDPSPRAHSQQARRGLWPSCRGRRPRLQRLQPEEVPHQHLCLEMLDLQTKKGHTRTWAGPPKPEKGRTWETQWAESRAPRRTALRRGQARRETETRRDGEEGRRRGRGAQPGQPYQDQDVGHDDVVTLQAVGPVRLELETAVLEE